MYTYTKDTIRLWNLRLIVEDDGLATTIVILNVLAIDRYSSEEENWKKIL